MTRDNAYKLLGVPSSATEDEIKKAFKRLAMKHHPDKQGNEENFKILLEAKDLLLRKTAYNNNGRAYSEEELIREYLRRANEQMAAMEERMAPIRKITKIRVGICILFLLKWTVCVMIGYSNWKFSIISLIVYGLLFYMAPTIAEIHNIYLKHYGKKNEK